MTLNQILNRIRQLALAHKQVRNFGQGLVTDFLADKTTLYPSVFLQDTTGTLSTSTKDLRLGYRMFLCDLVHVSEDTRTNEQDVQSDMLLIMMDLIAQMNAPFFDDWLISADNQVQLFVENENDQFAGCYIDFTIRTKFTQNICQIPTDFENDIPAEDMKLVYDMEYVASGSEGSMINIPGLIGKRILLVIRNNNPLHKVSNNPASSEYTWDNTTIGLGAAVSDPERFLILWRNY